MRKRKEKEEGQTKRKTKKRINKQILKPDEEN
jgi:hypothetical protein